MPLSPDILGHVMRTEETEEGLTIVVAFVDDLAMARAKLVAKNMAKMLIMSTCDRLTIDLATKDFYDGP